MATSVIEEVDVVDRKFTRSYIKHLTVRKVKIIPYNGKESFDYASIEEKPQSKKSNQYSNSSIRAHSMGPARDNPFTLTEKEEVKKQPIKNKINIQESSKKIEKTELEKLYGVNKPKVSINIAVKKMQAEVEELQKVISSKAPSKKPPKVFKRPAKIYHKRDNKPKEEPEFDYNW